MGLSKHLTSARTLGVGTPDYMAPELISFGLPHGGGGLASPSLRACFCASNG